MTIITNRALARIPHFGSFTADFPGAVAGWGRKASGRRAELIARLLRRGCLRLEDGFLRSVGRDGAPLSLLVDDLGVYYDAAHPCAMERAVARGATPAQAARARALIAAWRAGGLSKYNHAADYAGPLPPRYVLVADQCHGDLSVTGGLAGARDFAAMLAAALADHPAATVLVKTHPDVAMGRRRGWFAPHTLQHPRIRVIADGCHPVRLIAGAEAIYAVTSLLGFEGLLWGKPVRSFGMPFYAGWGLTADALLAPHRRAPATLEALVHAAFVALPRYADPMTGARWSAEQAFAHAAAARAAQHPNPAAARPVRA